jgi:hypothetical protein
MIELKRIPGVAMLLLALASSAVADDGFPADMLNEAPVVPLVRIIANPKSFDGKAIETRGYVHLHGEDFAVYLSKEAAEHNIREHALWLDFSSREAKRRAAEFRKLDKSYARVMGFFNAKLGGPRGGYSGGFRAPILDAVPDPKSRSAR